MYSPRFITALLTASAFALVACGGGDEQVVADAGETSVVEDTASTLPPTTSSELPLGAGPYPIATLEVEFRPADGKARTYVISCLGDTATITDDDTLRADAACLALVEDSVRTRLIGGVPADRMCTEIYGSADTARISGAIDGAAVDTEVDRANGCGIDDWDAVLAAVLPTITPS